MTLRPFPLPAYRVTEGDNTEMAGVEGGTIPALVVAAVILLYATPA